MSLKFVPPIEQDKFALSIGSFFKTYKSLGIAKISYHAHQPWGKHVAHILERVGNDWYILYTIENDKNGSVEYQDLPWVRKVEAPYYPYSSGYAFNNGTGYDRYRAKPMTREEYAEWRLKVEYERLYEMNGNDDIINYIEEQHHQMVKAEPDPSERIFH